MSQSTVIAGALLAGFVLFLAARNRLSTYAAVLWGSTAAQVPAPSGGASVPLTPGQAAGQAGSAAVKAGGNIGSWLKTLLPDLATVFGG